MNEQKKILKKLAKSVFNYKTNLGDCEIDLGDLAVRDIELCNDFCIEIEKLNKSKKMFNKYKCGHVRSTIFIDDNLVS